MGLGHSSESQECQQRGDEAHSNKKYNDVSNFYTQQMMERRIREIEERSELKDCVFLRQQEKVWLIMKLPRDSSAKTRWLDSISTSMNIHTATLDELKQAVNELEREILDLTELVGDNKTPHGGNDDEERYLEKQKYEQRQINKEQPLENQLSFLDALIQKHSFDSSSISETSRKILIENEINSLVVFLQLTPTELEDMKLSIGARNTIQEIQRKTELLTQSETANQLRRLFPAPGSVNIVNSKQEAARRDIIQIEMKELSDLSYQHISKSLSIALTRFIEDSAKRLRAEIAYLLKTVPLRRAAEKHEISLPENVIQKLAEENVIETGEFEVLDKSRLDEMEIGNEDRVKILRLVHFHNAHNEEIQRKIQLLTESDTARQLRKLFPSTAIFPWESIKLGEELSRGGFGFVKKATLFPTERDNEAQEVVVKFFSRPRQALQECKIAIQLHHKNIIETKGVTIFVGSTGNEEVAAVLALATETLRRKLGAKLDWKTVFKYCFEIASGLDYLHNTAKMNHLDLKPANVLLDENNIVKLCDFDLVMEEDETNVDVSHAGFGTLRWMCPEQYVSTEMRPANDVYSFGCILYNMIDEQGRKPWYDVPDKKMHELLVSLENTQESLLATRISFEHRADCPEFLLRLCKECLNSDYKMRPQHGGSLVQILKSGVRELVSLSGSWKTKFGDISRLVEPKPRLTRFTLKSWLETVADAEGREDGKLLVVQQEDSRDDDESSTSASKQDSSSSIAPSDSFSQIGKGIMLESLDEVVRKVNQLIRKRADSDYDKNDAPEKLIAQLELVKQKNNKYRLRHVTQFRERKEIDEVQYDSTIELPPMRVEDENWRHHHEHEDDDDTDENIVSEGARSDSVATEKESF